MIIITSAANHVSIQEAQDCQCVSAADHATTNKLYTTADVDTPLLSPTVSNAVQEKVRAQDKQTWCPTMGAQLRLHFVLH